MCIVPTIKTNQDVINLEWHKILAMLINNQESGRIQSHPCILMTCDYTVIKLGEIVPTGLSVKR